MTTSRHWTARAAVLLLCAAMAGCGWQLRGRVALPAGLDAIRVESRDPDPSLARELERALQASGVKTGPDAPVRLLLLRQRSLVRVATVTEQARVAEQQLTEEVEFAVVDEAGRALLPPTRVAVERIFEYDEDNVLATQDERELIRREMRRDLVSQILNRLRRLPAAAEAHADRR
ncbi:MAG: LPS-assembly lipoprotein LptE [Porticoccaceae bacterium]|nr:MAG: LPS-assembly lipoprotein LptE [Porticoccaceae bacterium]